MGVQSPVELQCQIGLADKGQCHEFNIFSIVSLLNGGRIDLKNVANTPFALKYVKQDMCTYIIIYNYKIYLYNYILLRAI
jgi:hypothetical protein